jgi:hypothetical protein
VVDIEHVVYAHVQTCIVDTDVFAAAVHVPRLALSEARCLRRWSCRTARRPARASLQQPAIVHRRTRPGLDGAAALRRVVEIGAGFGAPLRSLLFGATVRGSIRNCATSKPMPRRPDGRDTQTRHDAAGEHIETIGGLRVVRAVDRGRVRSHAGLIYDAPAASKRRHVCAHARSPFRAGLVDAVAKVTQRLVELAFAGGAATLN